MITASEVLMFSSDFADDFQYARLASDAMACPGTLRFSTCLYFAIPPRRPHLSLDVTSRKCFAWLTNFLVSRFERRLA